MQAIKWLSEISEEDIAIVGRNCYDLSLLYKARLPVANGFCISKQAYSDFLSKTGIKSKIENLLSQASIDSKEALNVVANEIRNIIVNAEVHAELKKELADAYSNMSISSELHGIVNTGTLSLIKAGRELPYVMVSNSFNDNIIAESNSIYSIKGIENILAGVKRCWAESITGSMLALILRKEVKEDDSWPGVICQKMISSSRAGLMHVNGDKIVIKALWGLYGLQDIDKIKPDVYITDNSEISIKDIEINNQAYAFVRDDNLGQTVKKEIPLARRSVQILSEAEIKRLAKLMTDIASMIGNDKQIEWAVDEGRLYITAVRGLRKTEAYNDDVFDSSSLVDKQDTVTDVSLAIDEINDEMQLAKADGVGLMESMLLQNKDEFFYYIRDGMEDAAVNGIADRLVKVATGFNQADIWYKLIDRPEKFYDWRYELEKEGKQEELIGLEIAAIRKARELGFRNIGILLPLVNDTDKVRNVKGLLRKAGLDPGNDIKIGIIIDNPACCHMINELLLEKINFVNIDIGRLARYSLAVKKGEEINTMHPAIMKQVRIVVEAARKQGVKTAVCNFNASLDIIEQFIKIGIDNITASNEDIELVRKSVAKVEKKLLLNVARDAFKRS